MWVPIYLILFFIHPMAGVPASTASNSIIILTIAILTVVGIKKAKTALGAQQLSRASIYQYLTWLVINYGIFFFITIIHHPAVCTSVAETLQVELPTQISAPKKRIGFVPFLGAAVKVIQKATSIEQAIRRNILSKLAAYQDIVEDYLGYHTLFILIALLLALITAFYWVARMQHQWLRSLNMIAISLLFFLLIDAFIVRIVLSYCRASFAMFDIRSLFFLGFGFTLLSYIKLVKIYWKTHA
jgi:hypothetical protein